ncbi:MAG TPA: hypothetical protein VFB59_00095, partial [Candidatus Saccharimonadales bacterium]|nr:hypothetical protein [Candidatus Saccharimonadales bacterium]
FGQLASGAPKAFDQATPQLQQELTALQIPSDAQTQIVTGAKACYADSTTQKDHTAVPASCQQMQGQATGQNQTVETAVLVAAKEANAKNFGNAYNVGLIFSLCALALTFALSFTLPRHFKTVEGQA